MTIPKSVLSLRALVRMVTVVVVIPLLPMLVAWRWTWWEAWAYALLSMVGFVLSRTLAARRHPDLLQERAQFNEHADTKPWDRALAPVLASGSALTLLVAGCDMRFGWSPMLILPVRLAGFALYVAGYVLGTAAMMENRFFSGTVRIQQERGHVVVSSGPYRWVRHPGYLGVLLAYLGLPALFGSLWALVPTALLLALLVLRTDLEDSTLQAELAGYREYAERVRYRLLPGIW